MYKVFPRETVIFLREDGSIPGWPSQVVTRNFGREKIVENMVVIANNIREKCLVGLLTDFRHRDLRIGQKPRFDCYIDDKLQSLFIRSVSKPPPEVVMHMTTY